MDLMWFLVLAHVAGDFALQSDQMARRKATSQAVLTTHVVIYTLTIALALAVYSSVNGNSDLWSGRAALVLGALFVLHWIQDFLKSRYFQSRQAYYQDQTLHLIQLFFLRWLVL